MTNWMLLERSDDLMAALFRQIERPEYVRLFDSTLLAAYRDFSPLLVQDDGVLHIMQQAPADWPGLIIESDYNRETLLDHLRRILVVRFDQGRKGMLRYWCPSVATHFFPVCTEQNIGTWLGPIHRVSWHAAPSVDTEPQWQSLSNPHAMVWQPLPSKHLPVLSVQHCQALEQRETAHSTGQES